MSKYATCETEYLHWRMLDRHKYSIKTPERVQQVGLVSSRQMRQIEVDMV